jgi:hypothetical protein
MMQVSSRVATNFSGYGTVMQTPSPRFAEQVESAAPKAPAKEATSTGFSLLKLLGNALMGTRYILPIANLPQAALDAGDSLGRGCFLQSALDFAGDMLVPGRGMVQAWGPSVESALYGWRSPAKRQ